MISRRLKIVRKIWFTSNIFGLEFRCPGIHPTPGQFFQIRVGEGIDPFLNRPISVASYKEGRLLLVIKVVGRGTRMLSTMEEGGHLTLFGPFGGTFRPRRMPTLLIAGGIGIAPLFFLAEYLSRKKIAFDLIYGVRTKQDFVFREEMTKMAVRSSYVAERGFKKHETVVSAMRKTRLDGYLVAYTCGPRQMLIELQKLHLPMFVYAFCEDFLGCGCGLCLGCAIKYNGAYKRICVDGPIFELGGIDFEV